jgi:hypothetical protein
MNPAKRLQIITDIALKLQAEQNTSGINILLSGYGIETKNVHSVSSKRQYVIDMLKSQSNEIIVEIARDLNFDVKLPNEKSKKQEEKSKANMQKKIFISHSSSDIDIVEKIIDTLEAIGVPSEQIFCSSFEGYGVKLGADFLETIKTELNSDVLVLFVLSSNFYASVVSLCEMGATWVKTNEHIPILIPPFEYSEIKGVIPTTHGMKINEKPKFNSLKEKVEHFMGLKQSNFSAWERKRDNILKEIKTLLDSRGKNPKEESNNTEASIDSISPVLYKNAGTKMKEQSKKEWPNDFEMQLDYIQRQNAAVERLKQNKPSDISSQDFKDIRKNAQKEWPNDFEMQLNFEQRQVESLRKLKDL